MCCWTLISSYFDPPSTYAVPGSSLAHSAAYPCNSLHCMACLSCGSMSVQPLASSGEASGSFKFLEYQVVPTTQATTQSCFLSAPGIECTIAWHLQGRKGTKELRWSAALRLGRPRCLATEDVRPWYRHKPMRSPHRRLAPETESEPLRMEGQDLYRWPFTTQTEVPLWQADE